MTTQKQSQRWRSLLYIPSNKQKFLDKAQTRGADALVLDLEDSIPATEKDNARINCAKAMAVLKSGPSAIVVRINGDFRTMIRDLEAVVQPGLQAVMVPKCDYPRKAVIVGELLDELEEEAGIEKGSVGIIPMIEAPQGYFAAEKIAKASSRNIAMILGGEDFATICDLVPSQETLLMARQQIVFAARAANISPLGLLDTVANFSDIEYMTNIAERAKRFGFEGSTCVHPALVPILNEAFSPSEDEIDQAKKIIAAINKVEKQGGGVATLNGKMIDAPIKARALRVLEKAHTSS